jgi:hypothetical protein
MTPIASTAHPASSDWRELPVVSELSETVKAILKKAKQNPNLDVNVFSKVGDCLMTADTFLGVYARWQ